jgi:hypothetical protein
VAAAVSAFESSSPREAQPQAVFVSPSAGPDISQLRDAQERLRDEALGGDDVSASTIRELVEQTKDLEEQLEVAALDARSRRELEMAISEQAVLLRLIASSRASEAAATQALEVTKRVAEDLGVDLPAIASPSAVVSPTPAPTAGPTLSPSPEPRASPTATPPAGTPTATAAPELP